MIALVRFSNLGSGGLFQVQNVLASPLRLALKMIGRRTELLWSETHMRPSEVPSNSYCPASCFCTSRDLLLGVSFAARPYAFHQQRSQSVILRQVKGRSQPMNLKACAARNAPVSASVDPKTVHYFKIRTQSIQIIVQSSCC